MCGPRMTLKSGPMTIPLVVEGGRGSHSAAMRLRANGQREGKLMGVQNASTLNKHGNAD